MIGIAHAVSYGINTLRYIKGESEKKRHPEKIYHVCNQFLPNDIDAMGMWTMMNFKINSHSGMKNGLFHVELSPAKECTDNFTMADWICKVIRIMIIALIFGYKGLRKLSQ